MAKGHRPQSMSGTSREQIERMYLLEARYGMPLRWLLLLMGVVALWSWRGAPRLIPLAHWQIESYFYGLYVLVTVAVTLIFLPPSLARHQTRRFIPISLRVRLITATHLIDLIFVSIVIAYTGGFRSETYLLYAILALKAAVYYPFARTLSIISFFTGIFWVLAAWTDTGSLFFLMDRGFVLRYVGMGLLIITSLTVGRLMERRQLSIVDLDANLMRKSQDLDRQARIVQDTANELGNRLLELRSLQESVKAINSSLALDELLQIIVESATRVLRGARCTIALVDARRESVITRAAAGIGRDHLWGTSFRIGQGIAGWVVENRRSVHIADAPRDPRYYPIGDWSVSELISVPLISDVRGETLVIGALTATSPTEDAFSQGDLDLLAAFADQAAIAVQNAGLYEQLAEQQKQTESLYVSVLEKSNELEAILRGIGDGVIVVDPELRLLMMNPIAARILHIREMPQEGVRLPEIVSNEDVLVLARETLGDLDTPSIREISLVDEGDRALVFQSLASSVRGADGHVRGIVMVMRDITTQKEVEQIKSNFLSVVSHELRTPLHSIKGFVDIILMGKTGQINDLQRDFLTTVKESTTNLQRLIDDLLEFSRMEAGRVKLEPENLSLFDAATLVAERLEPLAESGELAIVNQIPDDIALIEADPMRVEQVLTNLISNAIKFTDAGGTITLTAVDQGDEIEVCVRDTGIGIPAQELPFIFRRFYQVDSSATRSYRGAGLGLTICKFIVEYHHGSIWVESEQGVGSAFKFTLPKSLPQDQDLVIDFTTPMPRRQNDT